MDDPDAGWEQRLTEVLAELDRVPEAEFLAAVTELTAQLPAGHPVALFERGGAHDSTGDPARAVALYDEALAAGLSGDRRRRAVIQLASSRRNLGQPERALELLAAEADREPDELDAAVAVFRALALADLGREREGLALVVQAIADYLPRYRRSVAAYGAALVDGAGR